MPLNLKTAAVPPCAAAVVALASPAAATTITVDTIADPIELTSLDIPFTQDELAAIVGGDDIPAPEVEFVPSGSLAFELTLDGPGFVYESGRSAIGSVTNLSPYPVVPFIDYPIVYEIEATGDGPSVRAGTDIRFVVEGEPVNGLASPLGTFTPGDGELFDVTSFPYTPLLQPGETQELSYEGFAVAIAPVPVPAAAPLSLAALGALGWIGRRRAGRTTTA